MLLKNCRHWRPLSRLVLGWAIMAFGASAHAAPVHRHALLIGISDYHDSPALDSNKDTSFQDLECDTDIDLIKRALVHTFGFVDPAKYPHAGEIVMLTTPEQTTRKAILSALQHLVDETQPGDIVYFHYSGHGDQIDDPTEPSGLDSTIVPSDYLLPPPANTTEANTNQIAGKTLLHYIHALQAKHPAQIALSFDSCHSASVARGAVPTAKARGITAEEYAAWYAKAHPNYHAKPAVTRSAAEPAQAQPALSGAGYVVLSACRNTDKAFETLGYPAMGCFSECLAHAFMTATPTTTYRQIFDQVYAMFHQKYPAQHPQLDGSDPDSPLLGGTAIVLPPSFLVLVDKKGHYSLDAGQLLGMTVGSKFAIFGPGDAQLQPGTEVAEATIIGVTTMTSKLQVTPKQPGLTASSLSAAHAVETTHIYDTPPLTLDAKSLRSALPGQAGAILTRLRNAEINLHMVSIAPLAAGRQYDIAAVAPPRGSRGPATVSIVRVASGVSIKTLDPSSADLSGKILAALQKEARYRYACGLGEDQAGLNSSYHIAIRLLPSDVNGNILPATAAQGKTTDQRQTFHLNDYFVIQVQNHSGRPLHLAVLDLQSSGDIKPIWPDPGSSAHDNVIQPTPGDSWKTLWLNGGDTTTPCVLQASAPPDPDELYKAIATIASDTEGGEDDYEDFSSLATGPTRGTESPVGMLFGPALNTERGSKRVQMSPGTWTVADCPFQVN